mgnify:CR=1 FL=1
MPLANAPERPLSEIRSYRTAFWEDQRARHASDPNGFHPIRRLRGALDSLRGQRAR